MVDEVIKKGKEEGEEEGCGIKGIGERREKSGK